MIEDDIKAALEGTTPGPWYSHDGGAYVHVRSEVDRILICEISWHSSIRLHHPLKSESQANAKLFAAAPDLLNRALSEIKRLKAIPLPPEQGSANESDVWADFAAYLLNNCEGEAISEEGLQRAMSEMLAARKVNHD